MSIYLFKAARRPTYRRENRHLLAADRGTVVDAQYRMSRVAPEYFEPGSIRCGEEVSVVTTRRAILPHKVAGQ